MSDTVLGWVIVAGLFVAMITAIVVMNRLRERERCREWEAGKYSKGLSTGGAAAAGGLAAGNCGAGCGGGGCGAGCGGS